MELPSDRLDRPRRAGPNVRPVISSDYDHLKKLKWMIGTRVNEDDQARIETTCQWTRNWNGHRELDERYSTGVGSF